MYLDYWKSIVRNEMTNRRKEMNATTFLYIYCFAELHAQYITLYGTRI